MIGQQTYLASPNYIHRPPLKIARVVSNYYGRSKNGLKRLQAYLASPLNLSLVPKVNS